MIFRSKVDTFFKIVIFLFIVVAGAVTLLPLLFDQEAPMDAVIILSAVFLSSVGFVLWIVFSIKYVFYNDYLLVKGGPFKSKIPYQTITKVSPTQDIVTGYRILSSKEGLEIFYKSAKLGSVKISPHNRSKFISELKKRCPNALIQE